MQVSPSPGGWDTSTVNGPFDEAWRGRLRQKPSVSAEFGGTSRTWSVILFSSHPPTQRPEQRDAGRQLPTMLGFQRASVGRGRGLHDDVEVRGGAQD